MNAKTHRKLLIPFLLSSFLVIGAASAHPPMGMGPGMEPSQGGMMGQDMESDQDGPMGSGMMGQGMGRGQGGTMGPGMMGQGMGRGQGGPMGPGMMGQGMGRGQGGPKGPGMMGRGKGHGAGGMMMQHHGMKHGQRSQADTEAELILIKARLARMEALLEYLVTRR